jgi:quercetin dioxygenase-like cupin family protein
MKTVRSLVAAAVVTAFVALAGPSSVLAHGSDAEGESILRAYQYAIANVPGKTLTALIVDYVPGGKSPPHRHGSAFVVGYVLSGAVRSQLGGGESRVYHAGESWIEQPGAHHTVSENASDTESARLLAIFVADTKATDLVTRDE